MDYFIHGLKEYFNFSGRERRQDYWMFILIYFLIYIFLTLIDIFIGTTWLGTIFSLAMIIPSINFATRRLHDTGRSGWWQLLYLIPLIGAIVVLIFLVLDSHPGENAYGISPKYA